MKQAIIQIKDLTSQHVVNTQNQSHDRFYKFLDTETRHQVFTLFCRSWNECNVTLNIDIVIVVSSKCKSLTNYIYTYICTLKISP